MRRVGLVCAILVLLIGLFTLIEYGFNLNFGIDQLLFKVSTIGVGEVAPGRMAVPSALNFLLLGLGLLLLSLDYCPQVRRWQCGVFFHAYARP